MMKDEHFDLTTASDLSALAAQLIEAACKARNPVSGERRVAHGGVAAWQAPRPVI